MTEFKFKAEEVGRFASVEQLRGVLREGVHLFALTDGSFSLIDIVRSLLRQTGPAHVTCATWSAGIKDVHQAKWLVDEGLVRTWTVILDQGYKSRQPKYAASVEQLFGVENIRVARIHAKFVLIHNEDWRVCIRTSMNLNANAKIEYFEIDEGGEAFGALWGLATSLVGEMPAGFTTTKTPCTRFLRDYFANDGPGAKPSQHWSQW